MESGIRIVGPSSIAAREGKAICSGRKFETHGIIIL
jgi:hypothetical protein